MAALVDEGLARAGRPRGIVPIEETEVFCKNARKLLVRGKSACLPATLLLVCLRGTYCVVLCF